MSYINASIHAYVKHTVYDNIIEVDLQKQITLQYVIILQIKQCNTKLL